jgi:DNA-binding PadR family transcriptional regulator
MPESQERGALTEAVFYILLSLYWPLHGYGIMQEVQKLSQGEMVIGPASLYTILKKLQNAKLIDLIEDYEERKKTYILTEKGKVLLKKDIKRRINMVEQGKRVLRILEESGSDGKEV